MGFAGMMALADIRRDIRGEMLFVSETSPAAVVILAAGERKRMKSRTPKVLHTLCGRTLLGHARAAADELNPARLVVVVGHGRELVGAEVAAATPQARIVHQDQK